MSTWTPHITAFNDWLLVAGRQPSTIATRTRWLDLLARTYPSDSPLTITHRELSAFAVVGSPPRMRGKVIRRQAEGG